MKRTSDDLELRLKALEREYELARQGLQKGMFATAGAFLSAIATLVAGLFAFIMVGPGFLSGTQLVVLFGMLIAALLIYFSFVFGRAAKIRVEIAATKKLLDVSSGENVRDPVK